MKNIQVLTVALLFALAGCAKKEKESSLLMGPITSVTTTVSARQYAETDSFLNVDARGKSISELSDTSKAKLKAAVYRFYKHVSLNNDHYSTTLKTGSEIKMSDDLFSFLKEDLDRLNTQIEQSKKTGKKYELPEVTPEYLNSLIQ